jgi:hypothetical protein
MAEDLCASRIKALSEKVRGLKARQLELTDAIEDQQAAGPSPDELAAIRDKIRAGFVAGPDSQRKALLQDMVAEVRVQSRRAVTPVFRLPLQGPSRDVGAVRELFRLVGRSGLEPPASANAGHAHFRGTHQGNLYPHVQPCGIRMVPQAGSPPPGVFEPDL